MKDIKNGISNLTYLNICRNGRPNKQKHQKINEKLTVFELKITKPW